MAFRDTYRKQVALLVRTLPLVAEESCFALKGGTANQPFRSRHAAPFVDIDLTYVPVAPARRISRRDQCRHEADCRARAKGIPDAKITSSGSEGAITQLTIRQSGFRPRSKLLRSCVVAFMSRKRSRYQIRLRRPSASPKCRSSPLRSLCGKIVAALDRQHPRDLFDVRDLLANEGSTIPCARHSSSTCSATDRPMSEVLAPTRKTSQLNISAASMV